MSGVAEAASSSVEIRGKSGRTRTRRRSHPHYVTVPGKSRCRWLRPDGRSAVSQCRQRPPPSGRRRGFPAGLLSSVSCVMSRLRAAGRRFRGFFGLTQRFEPGGFFSLGEEAGLILGHGLRGVAGLDFLFSEFLFRPFPGLFRRGGQCCFLCVALRLDYPGNA
jgi:hypothetical protein